MNAVRTSRFALPATLITALLAGSVCNAQGTDTMFARTVPVLSGWNYEGQAAGPASDNSACWQGRTSNCSANCPTGAAGSNVYLWATDMDSYTQPSCTRITRVKISMRAGFGADNNSTASGQIQTRVRGPFSEAALSVLTISGNQTWRGPDGGGWDITGLLGREWTAADVNALQVGVQRESRSAPNVPLWVDGFRVQVETVADRPYNDECSGAPAVGLGTIGFNTRCATTGTTGQSGHETWGSYDGVRNDLWYAYTAADTGYLTVETRQTAGNPNGQHRVGLYAACGAAVQRAAGYTGEDDSPVYFVTAGTRYLLQVGDWPGMPGNSGGPAGSGEFTLTSSPLPTNARCDQAITLPTGAFISFASGTTLGVPSTPVWFRWTAPASGRAFLLLTGSGQTNLLGDVFRGAQCDAGSLIGSADNQLRSDASTLQYSGEIFVTAGQQYSVRVQATSVFGNFAETGQVALSFAPFPANDGASGAIDVFGHGPHSFDARSASTGPGGQLTCGSSNGVGYDLWYRWTAPQSGQTWVSTAGLSNDQDTVLQLYGPNGRITCNDDLPGTAESGLQFTAAAGTSYLIQVGSYVASDLTSEPVQGAFEILYRCNLADLVGAGPASRLPDGMLDGSDFITFINSVSIGLADVDPAADVAGAGPSGLEPDGTIDGSDFIAFINAFASGC